MKDWRASFRLSSFVLRPSSTSMLCQQIPVCPQPLQHALDVGVIVVEMRRDTQVVVAAGENDPAPGQLLDQRMHIVRPNRDQGSALAGFQRRDYIAAELERAGDQVLGQ